MHTLTVEYVTERGTIEPVTDAFPTLEDATEAYSDADWIVCRAPLDAAAVRRITLRVDGHTIKTRSYPVN